MADTLKRLNRRSSQTRPGLHTTLLELIQTVSDYATSDDEIVATVASLINSGKALLCGNFAGARIDLSVPQSGLNGS